jgi:uncharacterized repeat protein (TIGR03803 family)
MRRRRLSLRLSSVLTIFAVGASLSATRAVAQVETVLYSFPESEGSYGGPTSGLIADQAGNLYGTTYQGGAYNGGTAFAADAHSRRLEGKNPAQLRKEQR